MESKVVDLSLLEPASIFISYTREDLPFVEPIEKALQQHGISVFRDIPSLALGANNVKALTDLIDNNCDAIIFFITRKFIDSDFIWRYEIPSALNRWRRESNFHIIPILQGISFRELASICADRGIISLTNFNAVQINDSNPSLNEILSIADRTLRSALKLRLAHEGEEIAALNISLHSFPNSAQTKNLHLDLNWITTFLKDGPAPEVWSQELLPTLKNVANTISNQVKTNNLEIWIKARLPVGIALGYSIPAKGSLNLQLHTDTEIWNANGAGSDQDSLEVITHHTGNTNSSAIIEVALNREVTQGVTKWRNKSGTASDWRIKFVPKGGPSRNTLTGDSQARGWAYKIGDEIRKLWDSENVKDIHLFVASTVEFAVLLGQQLGDRRPVHVYYGDNEEGYKLAFTLGL